MIFCGLAFSTVLMFLTTFFSGLSFDERFSIGFGEVLGFKNVDKK